MPRRAVTATQKAEAIALAKIIGAEAAAARVGFGVRAVRGWMTAAGVDPGMDIPPADWERIRDAAMAQVASDLAGGRVRPKDAAVIGAIATRNAAKPEPPAEPKSEAEIWGDQLDAAIVAAGLDLELATIAICDRYESSEPADPPWTIEQDLEYLVSLGDLREWWERQSIEGHEANERRLAENEIRKAAYIAGWKPAPTIDPETAELIALAEAWLGEGVADV